VHATKISEVDSAKQKAARRRRLNSILLIADQATINAGFDFRRYAMKPMPAKPRSSIAQMDGSGTAVIAVIVPVKTPSPVKVTWVTKAVALFGSKPKLASMPKTSNMLTPVGPKSKSVFARRSAAKTKLLPFQM
jgi:hypothetical protein